MNERKRTEISTLGEFGLIDHLTGGLEHYNSSTRRGVGDDAAVIDMGGRATLVTTDLLLEGIHFDLTYTPLKHLGYKSAMVNLSDIYAMNGTPRQLTVSLGISRRFCIEDIEELYAGIRLACEDHHVDIVGGDTTSSLTGLTISITCIGDAAHDEIVYRDGAKDTDLICVSGDLGAAYMGLQLLEREKAALKGNDDVQPDFAGREYILERQLRPEARRDIIAKLREAGVRPTAMIDISDGLSSELMHICKQSAVGCRIFEEHIPIDYQTAAMAEELNLNLTTCALNGGEDYELLFTVPIGDHEKIAAMEGVRMIGHITRPELGMALITRDGNEMELKAQGWNPLK
ncbi:MAG TPA: thiamine-phosphate kinase [Candidatus Avibacteroides avistercoris]|uniref:Thiamine-monophosphate kinase n=1 Tax=Candidatus Avibacteroides avistercoris TaxID=2840690 RepID=A0A9D2UHI2_9BACT|nr:thiamine-phosphate kinase [Candidatus Avibacteroides avistercoris]